MIDPRLPLVDLHRHLEGCVRLNTILELADQHGLELPARSVGALRPHVVLDAPVTELADFLHRLHWMIHGLADPDACRRVAHECVQDAAGEGLDYLELRFSPLFMAHPHGLDPTEVAAAVIDGARAAAQDTGLAVKLIGIVSRTFGPEEGNRELDALLAHREAITALDLAGDEARWPAELFHEHFRRGRDAGWRITVHAGEAGGAANVRYAVEELGATRIGHGIRAVEDPAVLDLLARRGVGLEINLTSNLQTRTVGSLAQHPLKFFLERGLAAGINTDDPVISGIDLRHEFEVAAKAAGLTPALARQAQEHALEMAYLSAAERADLRRRAEARGRRT